MLKIQISLIRQLLTHMSVAVIFFQLGTMTTSSKCLSLSSNGGRSQDWDLQMNRQRMRNQCEDDSVKGAKNKNTVNQQMTSSKGLRLPNDFLHGMAWIPKENFMKTFDTGIAIDNAGLKGQNKSVLLLYADKKSLPNATSDNQNDDFVKMISDPLQATENCEELQIVLTSTKRKNRCISILENWGGSPHTFRFLRWKKESNELHLGGRFFDSNGGAIRWQKVSVL